MNGDRALIYARTRQGDNDFERSRRQQVFLAAAGAQLATHPTQLAALISVISSLQTDFPIDQLPGLIAAMGSTPIAVDRGTVFGPSVYESAAACTCGYALEPNLPAIQATAAKLFPWAVVSP
jgi:hypothetical protein